MRRKSEPRRGRGDAVKSGKEVRDNTELRGPGIKVMPGGRRKEEGGRRKEEEGESETRALLPARLHIQNLIYLPSCAPCLHSLSSKAETSF